MITNVRAISFQRPFPSEVRPCRNARCSSAVHGDPSDGFEPPAEVCIGFVVNEEAATPRTAPPAAGCIDATASCAASRAGVIKLGDV